MAPFNQQPPPPLVPTSALRERGLLGISRPAKTPAYLTWGQIAAAGAEDNLLGAMTSPGVSVPLGP